ncbi:MAG TPA: TVP38/TMEM64 family protein [Stellaceae bacterium]|nr:TVP38/TMEM64 family protein [Stellaceae bacterium]
MKRAGRVLVLLLLVLGLVMVWRHRESLEPSAIKAAIGEAPMAPLLFLVAQVAASLLFIPRSLLTFAAGLIFGLWGGLVWASLGGVLGAIAGFLLARYVNGGLVDPETIPRLGPVLLRAERGGWRAVALLRLVPIVPHSPANYALGLTRISLADFTLGSALGQMPMTVAYTNLGAAGERALMGEGGWLAPSLIGLLVLALCLLLPRLAWQRER